MTNTKHGVSALEAQRASFPLIFDIRAIAASTPVMPTATPMSADELTSDPDRFIESTEVPVLIVCDIGVRSEVVTDLLRAAGYSQTVSLEGGMEGWIAAGLPLYSPVGLTQAEYRRYDRQLKLPDFGVSGQQALGNARVAVVGAGGLGAPVLAYLAAAGVGHITVIDSDDVEVSNLHRQPIYRTQDVGTGKARTAANFVSALNPEVTVEARSLLLDDTNALNVLAGHDIVVTCTDSFDTAHAINAAAVELGIPMVFGSVYRTEGQLAVFDARNGPCYACVFPSDADGSSLSCSIVGVLGPVTGAVGAMQAGEVVKLLTNIGEPSGGRLGLYDSRTQTMDSVTIRKSPACSVCGDTGD
jgi:molybdopterin/thiamine biosynthesis adenylyltransferase/rhodanese-related sulfurtransferase